MTTTIKVGDLVSWYGRKCVVLSVIDADSVRVREVRTGKLMILIADHLEACE